MTSTMTPEPDTEHGSIVVYLLAAPEDEAYCQLIKKHLKPVVRESTLPIELLDDFEIPPGADRAAHRARLFEADVVLSLVSVDFIDDDDVYERSQTLLARWNREENVIVSIIVRNCLWKGTPLAKFPVLPTNQQPINNRRHWPDQDEAVTEVVSHLYESISEIAEIQVIPHPPTTATEAPSTTSVAPAVQPSAEPGPSAATTAPPPTVAPPPVADPATAGLAPPTSPPVTEENYQAVAAAATVAAAVAPAAASREGSTSGAGSYTVKRMPAPAVEVDWREKYYHRVIWKRCFGYVFDSALFVWAPWALFGEDVGSIFALVFLIGAPWMESRRLGTPGKLILKIQITGVDGEPISYWHAFWRNILRTVTFYSYILIVPLIYQISRFKTTKKLYHDEWSKTVIGERL